MPSLQFLILAAALLLLIIYVLLWWHAHTSIKVPRQLVPPTKEELSNATLPSISIVIITHDSDHMLQIAIDKVVRQQYPDFEIVVVDNASTDETADVIKRAAAQHPNLLRSTRLPRNTHGLLHMSMAVTLGIRASRKDWIVLLRPNSTPKTDLWLLSIAEAIAKGNRLCIGYNHYYGYYSASWERKAARWYRHRQLLNYNAINSGKRTPIGAEPSNFTFNKADFLANRGYGKWLHIANYHEQLYAASNAIPRQTTFLTMPDAQVETVLPPIRELWNTERQQTLKAARQLPRSVKLRRGYNTRLAGLFLLSVLTLAAGVLIEQFPALCAKLGLGFLHNLNPNSSITPNQWSVVNGQWSIIAVILFFAIAVIHFTCSAHARRQDNKRLHVPLVTNPTELIKASTEY